MKYTVTAQQCSEPMLLLELYCSCPTVLYRPSGSGIMGFTLNKEACTVQCTLNNEKYTIYVVYIVHTLQCTHSTVYTLYNVHTLK